MPNETKILERETGASRPITRLATVIESLDLHNVEVEVSVANSAGVALVLYLLKAIIQN